MTGVNKMMMVQMGARLGFHMAEYSQQGRALSIGRFDKNSVQCPANRHREDDSLD
jgi:hypothetical protein